MSMLDRAQGCLLGQFAGDALGSLVEFMPPELIRREFPEGVREMRNGGTWNTIAGQLTDDSEMALMLAGALIEQGAYVEAAVRKAYVDWLESEPFDYGQTVLAGLRGRPNHTSQANGALMRISPLGIFGAMRNSNEVATWARADALLTHPHPVCVEANALFARALATAIREANQPKALYEMIRYWADEASVPAALSVAIEAAAQNPPPDYIHQQGWVLIAFQNALWQLLHAPGVEEGVVDTIMRGGDTDTNAAICGALLGAVHGRQSMPTAWTETLLHCRPAAGAPGVIHPRPECFWPVDVLEVAEKLLGGK